MGRLSAMGGEWRCLPCWHTRWLFAQEAAAATTSSTLALPSRVRAVHRVWRRGLC